MRHHPVIAFVVPYPFEILDLTGPVSVFERAALHGERYYSIRILSTRSSGDVTTEGGMVIADTCKYSDYVGPIDTLIVSGGVGAVSPQPPELMNWLRERSVHTRRVASTCTGAFLLAGAGLLDGCRVAKHWQYCDLLQSRHKNLTVERDPIFIKQGKFYTTAGVTSGIDLSLALVEEDLGHATAVAIARTWCSFLGVPEANLNTVLARAARGSGRRANARPSCLGQSSSESKVGRRTTCGSCSDESTDIRAAIQSSVQHNSRPLGAIASRRSRDAIS